MPPYEFNIIDMPSDDDDDNAYNGPDAYLEGDDNVLELENGLDDALPAHTREPRSTIAQILPLFDLQQLQPGSAGDRTTGTSNDGTFVTYGDLVRLLRTRPSDGDQEDDGEDSGIMGGGGGDDDDNDEYSTSSPRNKLWYPPHAEPQPRGIELLMSGEFGRISHKLRWNKGNRNLARSLLDRPRSSRSTPSREELSKELVPNSNGTAVASNGANLYVGQFSKDSSFYYTCCQDFRLHVYDMKSPPAKYTKPQRNSQRRASLFEDRESNHESTLKLLKTIQGQPGRWTITDSHLSSNNERMIYSSISPTVYMTSMLDSSTIQTPIRFAEQDRRQNRTWWGVYDDNSFGIWSCRFSADGNEVIAGGSGHIFVYDLLADRRTVKIQAHSDDVNSCCWADTSSGNVLISASDDTFLKVWDRRSLGGSRKPSGVLVGHTEGITNVSPKGDGRYIVSNGKDQALRLWDLRKMCSSDDFDAFAHLEYRCRDYDYRYGHFPRPQHPAHPRDCSVMTYRGHAVLRTLIRCNFSPLETTGSQYIYSGSADGRIHIWSLDGRIVQVLDRSQTLPMSFDPSGPELEPLTGSRVAVCVRDVSWSSRVVTIAAMSLEFPVTDACYKEPVLMSVGWESSRVGGSIVARHEWKGLAKMAYSLEDFTEKQRIERSQRVVDRAAGYRRVPGAFEDEDE